MESFENDLDDGFSIATLHTTALPPSVSRVPSSSYVSHHGGRSLSTGFSVTALPISQYEKRLLWAINTHSVVILAGETGSGKSTQLPQYLYRAGWCDGNLKVGLSLPRRVSVLTLAHTVASQMQSPLGDVVGYSIRFDKRVTPQRTCIKFITDGMLLREMLFDPLLFEYSVIIVDDAHDRSLNTDMLLALLKKILKRRPTLRIVISSATLECEDFANFFKRTDYAYLRKHHLIEKLPSRWDQKFATVTPQLSEPSLQLSASRSSLSTPTPLPSSSFHFPPTFSATPEASLSPPLAPLPASLSHTNNDEEVHIRMTKPHSPKEDINSTRRSREEYFYLPPSTSVETSGFRGVKSSSTLGEDETMLHPTKLASRVGVDASPSSIFASVHTWEGSPSRTAPKRVASPPETISKRETQSQKIHAPASSHMAAIPFKKRKKKEKEKHASYRKHAKRHPSPHKAVRDKKTKKEKHRRKRGKHFHPSASLSPARKFLPLLSSTHRRSSEEVLPRGIHSASRCLSPSSESFTSMDHSEPAERRLDLSRTDLRRKYFRSDVLHSMECPSTVSRIALKDVCCISVEGKHFPVDIYYLKNPHTDYLKSILSTVLSIHRQEKTGDILVFLTGQEEIETMIYALNESIAEEELHTHSSLQLKPMALYAELSTAAQLHVLKRLPLSIRKVICSTSLAETSITIENIGYVVDCGFTKIRLCDPSSGLEYLNIIAASRMTAKQRAGRAGRTQP
ncbi:hypothetical protein IE077_001407, partial [Cardiosporidium cionae]